METISLNTKQVGYIILIVSLLLGAIVYQYTDTINKRNAILHRGCNLSDDVCPFKQGMPNESLLGILLTVFLFLFGAFLIYNHTDTSTILKKKSKKVENISKTLEADEKQIYDAIVESEGAIYQKDLVTKTGMTKVKVTRILDFLEARGLVERKRRGMSNLVILKQL